MSVVRVTFFCGYLFRRAMRGRDSAPLPSSRHDVSIMAIFCELIWVILGHESLGTFESFFIVSSSTYIVRLSYLSVLARTWLAQMYLMP